METEGEASEAYGHQGRLQNLVSIVFDDFGGIGFVECINHHRTKELLSFDRDGGSSKRRISEDGFSVTDIFGSSRRCSSNDGGKGEDNGGEFPMYRRF